LTPTRETPTMPASPSSHRRAVLVYLPGKIIIPELDLEHWCDIISSELLGVRIIYYLIVSYFLSLTVFRSGFHTAATEQKPQPEDRVAGKAKPYSAPVKWEP